MSRHSLDLLSLVGGLVLTILGVLAIGDRISDAFTQPAAWLVGVAVLVAALVVSPVLRRDDAAPPIADLDPDLG